MILSHLFPFDTVSLSEIKDFTFKFWLWGQKNVSFRVPSHVINRHQIIYTLFRSIIRLMSFCLWLIWWYIISWLYLYHLHSWGTFGVIDFTSINYRVAWESRITPRKIARLALSFWLLLNKRREESFILVEFIVGYPSSSCTSSRSTWALTHTTIWCGGSQTCPSSIGDLPRLNFTILFIIRAQGTRLLSFLFLYCGYQCRGEGLKITRGCTWLRNLYTISLT